MNVNMHQREYEKLKRQFRLEYEERIAALELIYKATNSDNRLEPSVGSRGTERTAGLKDTVRQVLPKVGSTFTLHDVATALESEASDGIGRVKKASLSSVLKRLEDDGEIEVVERGSGKRASVYKLKFSATRSVGAETRAEE